MSKSSPKKKRSHNLKITNYFQRIESSKPSESIIPKKTPQVENSHSKSATNNVSTNNASDENSSNDQVKIAKQIFSKVKKSGKQSKSNSNGTDLKSPGFPAQKKSTSPQSNNSVSFKTKALQTLLALNQIHRETIETSKALSKNFNPEDYALFRPESEIQVEKSSKKKNKPFSQKQNPTNGTEDSEESVSESSSDDDEYVPTDEEIDESAESESDYSDSEIVSNFHNINQNNDDDDDFEQDSEEDQAKSKTSRKSKVRANSSQNTQLATLHSSPSTLFSTFHADSNSNYNSQDETLKARFSQLLLEKPLKYSSNDSSKNNNNLSKNYSPSLLDLTKCNLASKKYTPLEKQVIEIKKKYPDTVLVVSCGYKYRFFGQDALVAAKTLNIVATRAKNFLSASFPTARLPVHLQKLVDAGFKVGIVSQMETAAIKKSNSSSNTLVIRQLTQLYTKATLIHSTAPINMNTSTQSQITSRSLGNVAQSAEDSMVTSEKDAHILCIEEFQDMVYLMCFNSSSGVVIYDSFENDVFRRHLSARLTHLMPEEVIFPETTSKATKHLLSIILPETQTRFESWKPNYFSGIKLAENTISDLSPANSNDFLQSLPFSEKRYLVSLSVLLLYLHPFQLDSVIFQHPVFHHFSTLDNHLDLDDCAIHNLHLFTRQQAKVDIWNHTIPTHINHLFRCQTFFGQRLLLRWFAAPSKDPVVIQSRHDSVSYFVGCHSQWKQFFHGIGSIPDLEKWIARIYYKRCQPRELWNGLETLFKLTKHIKSLPLPKVNTPCVDKLIDTKNIEKLDSLLVQQKLLFNFQAAKNNDFVALFVDCPQYTEFIRLGTQKTHLENQLDEHLNNDCAPLLGLPQLQYTSVGVDHYLLSIPKNKIKRVPDDWARISQTKAVVRFRSPFITNTLEQLSLIEEQLVVESKRLWDECLFTVSESVQYYSNLIQLVAQCDVFYTFAQVALENSWVRPTIIETPGHINITNGRHPLVEKALAPKPFVPNSIALSSNSLDLPSCCILTGPNMGGKSCILRMIGVIIFLCQSGSFVPVESAQLSIFDNIFVRMGANDNLSLGHSTFFVEMSQAADILNNASSSSLVLMDELGRGTSTRDGTAIAFSSCEQLIQSNIPTLFVTHYPHCNHLAFLYPKKCITSHMSYILHEGLGTDIQDITFLYSLQSGPSPNSFGLSVAKKAALPTAILDTASKIRDQFSLQVHQTCIKSLYFSIQQLLTQDISQQSLIEKLVNLQKQSKYLFKQEENRIGGNC